VVGTHNSEVDKWTQVESDLRSRIADFERLVRQREEEIVQVRTEYERLKDMISGNISRTIQQTFQEHQAGVRKGFSYV